MADILLREATLNDREAVDAVRVRNGLEPERAAGAWEWLWRTNPDGFAGTSPGWVLEDAGCTVGFIGSVPRSYHFRGRIWTAAAARALVVDPEFRRESLRLVAAFFSNRRVDVLINTSANAAAAAVFRAGGARVLPQADYDETLSWVVSGAGVVSSFLRDRGVGRAMAGAAGRVAAPLAGAALILSRRSPGASRVTVKVHDPARVGEPFDRLWQELCTEWPERFLARRDSAALRWQWGDPAAASRQPSILAVQSDGAVQGYAVVTREDSQRLGLKRARIVDLIARGDCPTTLRALIAAAYRHAREQQVHVLEMLGFPRPVRAVALTLRPFRRRLPTWPFWYRALSPELRPALDSEAAWYASPLDGDAAL